MAASIAPTVNRVPAATALNVNTAAALTPVAINAQRLVSQAGALAGAAAATTASAAANRGIIPPITPPIYPHNNGGGSNHCVFPWILFIILAGIAIAVLISVIFGHHSHKQQGRCVDYFGQQQQQGYYAYPQTQQFQAASSSSAQQTLQPTAAQQATLAAQQSQAVTQDFSNIVSGIKNDLASVLQIYPKI